MKNIGDRIRQGRVALGLTQPELSKLSGVSKGTISMWETGTTSPNGKNLFSVSAALQLTPDYILTGEEASKDKSENIKTIEHDIELLDDRQLVLVRDYIEFVRQRG